MGIMDRKAVRVTGSRRGIGRKFSLGLAGPGAAVVVNDFHGLDDSANVFSWGAL